MKKMMKVKEYFIKSRRSMAVLLLLSMVLQSTIAYADVDDFTASPSEVEEVVGKDDPNNSATPSVTGNIADEDDETPDLTEYPEEPEENNPVGASSASPSDAEETEGNETPIEEPEDEGIASPSVTLEDLGFAMENEGGTLLGPGGGGELTFTAAVAGSTVKFDYNDTELSIEYKDSSIGSLWSTYNSGDVITLTDSSDYVMFRGNNTSRSTTITSFSYKFSMTGKINASGEVTSLIDYYGGDVALIENDFAYMFEGCTSLLTMPDLPTTTLANYCYKHMFDGCTGLTSLSAGNLPATTLANNCYEAMFMGCTGLTKVPANLLPATDLSDYCYMDMFYGCDHITTIETNFMNATVLADGCCTNMFIDCTSLTSVPILPITSLKDSCYNCMFMGCTALESLPSGMLPATNINSNCYDWMFYGCTNLKTVPSDLLPADELKGNCYYEMFKGCIGITIPPDLKATQLANNCYYGMFDGCISLVLTTLSTTTKAKEWKIPVTSTTATDWNTDMFAGCTNVNLDGANGKICALNTTYYTVGPGYYVTKHYNDGGTTADESVIIASGSTFAKPTDPSYSGYTFDGWYTAASGGTEYTSWPLTITATTDLYAQWNAPANYLTFKNKEGSSNVKFKWDYATSVEYNVNSGGWNTYTAGTDISLNSVGDVVQFRGQDVKTDDYNHFTITGKVEVSGSVTSLTDKLGNNSAVTLTAECYKCMFQDCTGILNVPELPATTLTDGCYFLMFQGCTALTSLPSNLLPAIYTDSNCYHSMFKQCTGLTSIPANFLPANEVLSHSYYAMFYGCENLTTVPTNLLSAAIVGDDGYGEMFANCFKLTSAPDLPATNIGEECYRSMFKGCYKITKAPTLSVKTLKQGCYSEMFMGCSGIDEIPELPATTLADNCYQQMFRGCSKIVLRKTKSSGIEKEWVIPASSSTVTDWNTDMFANCTLVDLDDASGKICLSETIYYTKSPVTPTPTPTPSSGGSSSGGGGGGGGSVSPAGKTLDPQIVSPGIVTNPLDPNAVVNQTLVVQQTVIPPTPVPTETKIQVNYDINTKKKVEVSKNPSVGHDDSGNAKLNLTGMDGVTYIADFGFYDVETKNAVTNYGGHIDTYYVNEASNLISGWIETANKNRYFMENVRDNNEGKMCHGWKRIVSDWYFFDYDGHMLKAQQTMDGFTVDGAGKMTNPSILDQTLINGTQQNIVYTMNKGYQHN